jgi:hypothetical protein
MEQEEDWWKPNGEIKSHRNRKKNSKAVHQRKYRKWYEKKRVNANGEKLKQNLKRKKF